MTLPFTTAIDIPLSAICREGTDKMRGHRVQVTGIRGRPRNDGQPSVRRLDSIITRCKNCHMTIEHDTRIGTYITPYTIQEMPY